jgi:Tol biopolymer transport system component
MLTYLYLLIGILLLPASVLSSWTESSLGDSAGGMAAWVQETNGASTSRIAYIGVDGNLWLMNPDGGGKHQVTSEGGYELPRWSPDGSAIAIVKSGSDPTSSEVWIIAANDFSRRRILSFRAIDDPFTSIQRIRTIGLGWYPDSSHLLYGVEIQLGMRLRHPIFYKVDTGQDITIVSEGLNDGCDCVVRPTHNIGLPIEFQIGPTGWIVGIRWEFIDSGGFWPDAYPVLFTASPDLGYISDMPVNCDDMEGASWSPDEQQVAYLCHRSLYVRDVHSGDQTILASVSASYSLNPTQSSWSPSGKALVFSFGDEIWHVDRQGDGLLKLAEGSSPDWQPGNHVHTPVPDSAAGARYLLAYIADDRNIWLIDNYGSQRRQLTHTANVRSFAWSPSGEMIAYTSEGNESDVYVINANGSNLRRLTGDGQIRMYGVEWIASKVFFVRDLDPSIFTAALSYIDVNDADQAVTDVVRDFEIYEYGLHYPVMLPTLQASPDGQWLVFESLGTVAVVKADGTGYREFYGIQPRWRRDSARVIYYSSAIQLIDPASGSRSHLSNVEASFMAYSPEDFYIAYAHEFLWRMNPDNTNHLRLSSHLAAHPAWSPDGGQIAYARWYPSNGFYGYHGIYIVDIDGKNRHFLTHGSDPQWRPVFAPSLALNYQTGASGSSFQVFCSGFPPLASATVSINGVTLGNLATDEVGNLIFNLITDYSAQAGIYLVSVEAGVSAYSSFHIDPDSEIRPTEGDSNEIEVPPNIAPYTDQIYLPALYQIN